MALEKDKLLEILYHNPPNNLHVQIHYEDNLHSILHDFLEEEMQLKEEEKDKFSYHNLRNNLAVQRDFGDNSHNILHEYAERKYLNV